MNIIIRRAEKEDCEAMMNLVKELAIYERAEHEVSVTTEHFIESGFGNHPVWWGFVAEENGKLIGLILYYIRYSTWKGQRMYLEDFVVTEPARNKGVGKLLFDRLIEEAKEKKLTGIVWQVLKWNEPAINFYKKYNAVLDGEWYNCSIETD